MNGTVKRFFVATSAAITLSTALLLSTGAQSKPYDGVYDTEQTNVSPADQNASIRGQGN